jgi:hypothetical protein
MSETARRRLRRLLAEYQSGALNTETFCIQFEHTYNMELDKKTLSASEALAFSDLFERVIWYSPFAEERANVPNYRGDAEIREAVERAAQRMGTEAPS